MTRRWPSIMAISVWTFCVSMAGGVPSCVPKLTVGPRELLVTSTAILSLYSPPFLVACASSRQITVGITSSWSSASLNWICVPAALTVA